MSSPSLPSAKGEKLSVRVDGLEPSEWSNLLEQFDDASVYQSWAYGTVHWGRRQLSHMVVNRGSTVIGAAQVRLVQVPVLGSGVAYVRWGPLCRLRGGVMEPDALLEVNRALKQEYVERRGLGLRIVPPIFRGDPLTSPALSAWKALGLCENRNHQPYRTLRVDLTAPPDGIRKRLNQKWRNCLNAAERNGLDVVCGSGVELYDKFLTIYQQMMARKQFETTVDVHEFRTIQSELPEKLKMQVLVCEKNGKLLNAMVISAIGDTAIYLLGATSEDGLNLKGAYLLQWRAMQLAKERGCSFYDLGGVNPERNPGVYRFKSGMGGGEVTQFGLMELGGPLLSRVVVGAGEGVRSLATRFKTIAGRVGCVAAPASGAAPQLTPESADKSNG